MTEKIEAYLGFCLRSGKIALGSGSVELTKRGVYLIIVCSSASENTFKFAIKMSYKFSCPLMICKNGLENSVHKPGCKIAAVKDAELAKAICGNACAEYELYTAR